MSGQGVGVEKRAVSSAGPTWEDCAVGKHETTDSLNSNWRCQLGAGAKGQVRLQNESRLSHAPHDCEVMCLFCPGGISVVMIANTRHSQPWCVFWLPGLPLGGASLSAFFSGLYTCWFFSLIAQMLMEPLRPSEQFICLLQAQAHRARVPASNTQILSHWSKAYLLMSQSLWEESRCYRLNSVPHKFICWSHNPHYLRMWLTGSFQGSKIKMKSSITSVLVKWKFGHRYAYRENALWRWRQKSEVMLLWAKEWQNCQRTRKLEERPGTVSLRVCSRNEPWWHLDFRLLSSRVETINFCCSSHVVCGILLWQPKQTNTAGQ